MDLVQVDPPRGMLQLVASKTPWYLSHQGKPPARVRAIVDAERLVSLEGIGRVPVDEITSFWKERADDERGQMLYRQDARP